MAGRNDPADHDRQDAPVKRRSGRPRGETGTRESILEAARGEFLQHGFDRATIRGIAGSASVDPALVHHYYGTKQNLFIAALQLPPEIPTLLAKVLAGSSEDAGERLVRFFFSVWDGPGAASPFLMLLRSAVSNPQATAMLREFVTDVMIRPTTEQLAVDGAAIRAPLAASHMIGIAFLRYLIELEPIKSASVEALVAMVGPTLQRYLTGPLPDIALSPGETAGNPAGTR